MIEPFADALSKRILVCDGATGTMLYERGGSDATCFEELNLTDPDKIRLLHSDYIKAGVDIIQTNTFAANREKLAKHNLESKVDSINRAGVRLAKEVAQGIVYVAGTIGPIGLPLGQTSDKMATAIFEEQASSLIDEGSDLIILETFHSVERLVAAIKSIRSISSTIPIIAQMTFIEDNKEELEADIKQFVESITPLDITACGANCSVGPSHMLESVKLLSKYTKLPISAQPNAGMPKVSDDRLLYLTTPEYLLTYGKRFIKSGASIVGGCCGVTPDHIRALSKGAKALSPSRLEVKSVLLSKDNIDKEVPCATELKTNFSSKLAAKEWVQSVELLSPKGSDYRHTVRAVSKLKSKGIEFVNIPDGPRAMARMNSLSFGLILKQESKVTPIIHYTCRDRNLIGMQADILGADGLGIKDILIITGDPPKLGKYPDATAVYDFDSIGLVKLISNLNRGVDIAGSPIKGKTSIHIGVGGNPGALNIDEELRRFESKVEAGAEFCMTQPVYDNRLFEKFLKSVESFKIPILIGILPLTSHKMAEFLHNEVPGMTIPSAIRNDLSKNQDGAKDIGAKIAKETLDCFRDTVDGVYMMSPAVEIETILSILS
ncbi:MAG: bifunctional homocysteine S-methyltransferase/methylenetetrahydrofolate reductase [Nitrospinota bacterium]